MRVWVSAAEFAQDIDTGGGFGQIVEAELKKGAAIFVLALRGALQLAS
jgi:hypothetical protein